MTYQSDAVSAGTRGIQSAGPLEVGTPQICASGSVIGLPAGSALFPALLTMFSFDLLLTGPAVSASLGPKAFTLTIPNCGVRVNSASQQDILLVVFPFGLGAGNIQFAWANVPADDQITFNWANLNAAANQPLNSTATWITVFRFGKGIQF